MVKATTWNSEEGCRNVAFQDEGKTTCRMIDYGLPPASDQIEVTLFGPGYGEAIAVHLGENNWLLVDSCIDPNTGSPAALTYLDCLGVLPEKVKTIVASHWHDDHVRGIFALAEKYNTAEFQLSAVFTDQEAMYFLAAFSGNATPGQSRGSQELFKVMQSRDVVSFVAQRSNILELKLQTKTIRVTALSPVHAAIAQSVAHMAQYLPRPSGGSPINHAPELQTNLESITIHIDLGDDAILLGADLEDHNKLGWSAVVEDAWCKQRLQATAYKVAHHGSVSGDSPVIWASLLRPEPVACLTPFSLGAHRLPTDDDRERIRSKTPHRYISSGSSRRPEMDRTQLKRLQDICRNLTRVNSGFGAVRLRKKQGEMSWGVECFGTAQAL